MKKSIICLLLVMVFALSGITSAMACWSSPESFEILSEDGKRVFVFNPAEYANGDAYAALYEINNNQRQVIYTVENLSSFSYENSFRFTADMMHFVRIFPPYGMPVFEVFSNGIKTHIVHRNDFIKDYAGIESESSIGPFYTVTWEIDEHTPYNDMLIVRTTEGNTLLYNLITNEFTPADAIENQPPENMLAIESIRQGIIARLISFIYRLNP